MTKETQEKIDNMADSLVLWDARYGYWQALMSGAIQTTAPALVPFTPAAFVGFEIYAITSDVMPAWLSIPLGIFSAFGLEAVGFTASHTTLRLYEYSQRNEGQGLGKVLSGGFLVLSYMIAAIMIIWFSQVYTYIAVGIGLVILTIITYVSQALAAWVRWAERQEDKNIVQAEKTQDRQYLIEDEERKARIELEFRRIELDQEKDIAIAEARQRASVERTKAKIAGQNDLSTLDKMTKRFVTAGQNDKPKMTKIELRKQKAISLWQSGLSPDDIANELNVSNRTIKRYLNGKVVS